MPLACRLLLSLVVTVIAAGVWPVQASVPFAPDPAQLHVDYWIARLSEPDRVLLDSAQVSAFNADLLARDRSLTDLSALPAQLSRDQVRARIQALSASPSRPLYDPAGVELGPDRLRALHAALALDALPAQIAPRYGLIVARAPLRRFPTALRAFSRPGDHDIDRFQETALYPGSAVAVLHRSADQQWLFVIAPNYAAWVARDRVALGTRATVLAESQRQPRLWITGAQVHSVFTPTPAAASQLLLDMGSSLPLLDDWPAQQPVNGQSPLAAQVVSLPLRRADGSLELRPALLPRGADTRTAPLPASPRNLLQQAFKFLGERYGWGNDYQARDCSGLLADVYRSLGLLLPRNTGDQARSPALTSLPLPAAGDRDARRALARTLRVGDLIYLPGHVMMVIGHDRDLTWVIHDVAGASYHDPQGRLQRLALNGVTVTALEPLRLDDGSLYLDHISAIRRLPAHIPAS